MLNTNSGPGWPTKEGEYVHLYLKSGGLSVDEASAASKEVAEALRNLGVLDQAGFGMTQCTNTVAFPASKATRKAIEDATKGEWITMKKDHLPGMRD